MAEMTPEERVELVLDIVAEEILRQMREMQAAAQENLKSKFTIDTAREEMKRIGLSPINNFISQKDLSRRQKSNTLEAALSFFIN